ncbi:MAG: hypothetical protein J07AB43_01870 [Candidatus Nanosalina sp. J07AB43]|jgi:hypothetical protein|nr:MAG: hypothetical protein J07AB43_01870 [Candidatus Nanosalina sp. J07AB43]
MIRPFTKEKIVYDPDEKSFYLVSRGIMGSPRPFRNIEWFHQDGRLFSADEARVDECVMSRAGQRFGTASILSELGLDASSLGVLKFEDMPDPLVEASVERARKYCVGVLEATEVQGKTQEELERELQQVLDGIDPSTDVEEVESEVTDLGEDVDRDDLDIKTEDDFTIED